MKGNDCIVLRQHTTGGDGGRASFQGSVLEFSKVYEVSRLERTFPLCHPRVPLNKRAMQHNGGGGGWVMLHKPDKNVVGKNREINGALDQTNSACTVAQSYTHTHTHIEREREREGERERGRQR